MHHPWTAAIVGFLRVPELHVHVDVLRDHAVVGDRVPHAVARTFTGLRARGSFECVAGAERRPLGAQQDHVDVAVGVGAIDRGSKLVAQFGRDRVVLGGAGERDDADAVASLSAERLHGNRI